MAHPGFRVFLLSPKLSSLSSPDGKGLRLLDAGERDPSRLDGKVGEVDVNRPVMVVEFYECDT